MGEPNKEELACVYASIILADEGREVTPEGLQTILQAAGVRVQPIWLSKFSQFMADRKLEDLVGNISVGAAAPAAAGVGGGAAAAEAVAEPEPEPEEEEDDDMGFSLFD